MPGESATHFLGVSGNGSYSAEMTEEKAIGSPFWTWVSRSKDKRKREKGEGQTVSPKPGGKRWKWSWSRSLGGKRGLRCIPAPMSTNEQLGRQDQSYWSGFRLFSQGWLVCLRLCYGCYSCGHEDTLRGNISGCRRKSAADPSFLRPWALELGTRHHHLCCYWLPLISLILSSDSRRDR